MFGLLRGESRGWRRLEEGSAALLTISIHIFLEHVSCHHKSINKYNRTIKLSCNRSAFEYRRLTTSISTINSWVNTASRTFVCNSAGISRLRSMSVRSIPYQITYGDFQVVQCSCSFCTRCSVDPRSLIRAIATARLPELLLIINVRISFLSDGEDRRTRFPDSGSLVMRKWLLGNCSEYSQSL
jgi:hypothetical protein